MACSGCSGCTCLAPNPADCAGRPTPSIPAPPTRARAWWAPSRKTPRRSPSSSSSSPPSSVASDDSARSATERGWRRGPPPPLSPSASLALSSSRLLPPPPPRSIACRLVVLSGVPAAAPARCEAGAATPVPDAENDAEVRKLASEPPICCRRRRGVGSSDAPIASSDCSGGSTPCPPGRSRSRSDDRAARRVEDCARATANSHGPRAGNGEGSSGARGGGPTTRLLDPGAAEGEEGLLPSPPSLPAGRGVLLLPPPPSARYSWSGVAEGSLPWPLRLMSPSSNAVTASTASGSAGTLPESAAGESSTSVALS